MNNLTSKLQYKTYEKGEFSDEQGRSLEETLALIKAFPWDEQRGADVQLTGPGVVIEGPTGDYLKIGTYFSNKLALYYLDAANHLYEFHTEDAGLLNDQVIAFFNQNIDLTAYEKHLFSINSRSHFINGWFWHMVSKTKIRFLIILLSILLIAELRAFSFIITRSNHFSGLVLCIGLLFILLFGYSLVQFIRVYLRTKDMALWITSGHNIFKFDNGNGTTEYKKSEIKCINFYGPTTSRNRPMLNLMEVIFMDDQAIKIPGMLMDSVDFIGKLSGKITVNQKEKSPFLRKYLWQF